MGDAFLTKDGYKPEQLVLFGPTVYVNGACPVCYALPKQKCYVWCPEGSPTYWED